MSPPDEAIADTIRQRLFSGLHLGLLTPGAKLPSARELAAELGAGRRAVLTAWRWVADDGSPGRTQSFPVYDDSARYVQVFESGTLSVDAWVNGENQTRELHFHVGPPTLTLKPSRSWVPVGDTVQFRAGVDPAGAPFTVTGWAWRADSAATVVRDVGSSTSCESLGS